MEMTLEGSNSAETFPPGVGGVRLHTGKIREVSDSKWAVDFFCCFFLYSLFSIYCPSSIALHLQMVFGFLKRLECLLLTGSYLSISALSTQKQASGHLRL